MICILWYECILRGACLIIRYVYLTTGLCLIQYPELLKGTRVLQLANGTNARYLALRYRNNELGELPEKVAKICQNIYNEDLTPQLKNIAPWLVEQTHVISEIPII